MQNILKLQVQAVTADLVCFFFGDPADAFSNPFGKNYYAIVKEEYNAVRKNVPMAISD
ncbi:hypothetical protein [Chryseolinea sp. H1M3-3]|uniref:hypothetical protein n=1 Tax=Chryseolinea sp. H1M3-3 TaxID=3034144 RepID=UPI0023EB3A01|nr:hypothetical protein [Chryseolinea sp. H1M3-3]